MTQERVRLGIAGLGMAGAVMVHAARAHPDIALVAAADPHAAPRDAFVADTGLSAYADIAALCDDPAIEAIYIATPHQFHAAHVSMAAAAGKHVIVEKPIALDMADAAAIVAAAEAARVTLIVGHTHGFDPGVRLMRRMIASGAHGRLGLIAQWNYTSYLYRPRRPEELDTARGGGIVFNQMPHQIDVARVLAGARALSVRAHLMALDPARPTEALGSALIFFDGGAAASLTYSGHDQFDADEFHGWTAESGAAKAPAHGAARRALAGGGAETAARTERFAYGAAGNPPRAHLPHFGVLIATCAGADLRATPDGVAVYDANGVHEVPAERRPGVPGRAEVLDDLVAALRRGVAPLHDGRWGMATLEVALAMLTSAREGREVVLGG
jgi:phthalate 4,5-cis-dihydrodiol dehydrogenase